MNTLFTDIFLKIARKLGFQLQEKQDIENDFYDVEDISITAIMSERLATLIVADSDIHVTGNKKIEEVIDPVAKKFFETKLKTSVVTSLGTGDCLIVPVTNGKVFDIDIVDNDNFYVVDSLGDNLYAVVMKRDEFKKGGSTFRRFELHTMEEINGVYGCTVYRYGFKDSSEIDFQTVDAWKNIPTTTRINNVDRLLFGRIKCPTVNRENVNSSQGVPITYGLDKAVEKAKQSYMMFNEEFRRKQTKIFARKDLFVRDNNNGITIPDNALYQMVGGDLDGELPIKEFSPDLRYDGLKGGVDFNFKMLELFCGLSSGVLTEVTSNFATATEIKASMNATFSFINIMRKYIDNAMNDLVYAVAMLYNANSITGVIGKWAIGLEWDDSIKENSTETFNMMLQAYGIGELKKGEIRAWLNNIPQGQAEAELEESEVIVEQS